MKVAKRVGGVRIRQDGRLTACGARRRANCPTSRGQQERRNSTRNEHRITLRPRGTELVVRSAAEQRTEEPVGRDGAEDFGQEQDVVIVGGGITGLCAALVRKEKRRVKAHRHSRQKTHAHTCTHTKQRKAVF